MNKIGWLTILIFVWAGKPAPAQESMLPFNELVREISIGENVRIIDKSGNTIEGKIEYISPDALTLRGRKANLSADSIQVLQKRRKDPWWNGLLIGGGAGAAGGILLAASQCRDDSECSAIARVIFVPAGAAIGMATGALIDSAVSKYDTVFRSGKAAVNPGFQVSPVISREQKGIGFSFAF